ncbi:hypothetical protein MVES1_002722 [Malassezia vespertilionis]|uniref:[histone H3]-trimethyl-L-lysine(9) demethylase n=1 Tax=Malassezia vespertilionis TaxID=2020962 RepID=A0A2N1JB83_9BASI|nr:uncharacterized protein MVES1_002722 [Malassezia vespertilionis]PKI83772.1 hypothetical protein MVES_002570 [Malassezia vespertilionis]WFD07359.1 hypothetical protein MVES1_002722 [Malassezia vespertilionis]
MLAPPLPRHVPGLGQDLRGPRGDVQVHASWDGAEHRTQSSVDAAPLPASDTKAAPPSLDNIQPAYYYPMDAYAEENTHGTPPEHGIPVFTPTMAQFQDFYTFCQAIDRFGMQSGIVKIIPPQEWIDALPSIAAGQSSNAPAIDKVHIRNAIQQHFIPAGPGQWKQANVTRTSKVWDAKQWADVCNDAAQRGPSMSRIQRKVEADREAERMHAQSRAYENAPASAPVSQGGVRTRSAGSGAEVCAPSKHAKSNRKTSAGEWQAFDFRRAWTQEALLDAERAAGIAPPSPAAWDVAACRAIESEYWRSLNFGRPPMYGADLQGTLYDARTKSWNVGTLDSLLSRKLNHALPGVTTPYLYFGMWRASFAWHVEDMDLYSINYLHFGAPKQWYAIRQADRARFESVMAAAFPADSRQCAHFMRHKSFLASPSFLQSQGVRPLRLVQHAHEFVITYPYGYHAGYNLGFNCAESVNFALPSWVEIGRAADYCKCALAQESVHFDVDEILGRPPAPPAAHGAPRKRRKVKDAEAGGGAYVCVFCTASDAHDRARLRTDAVQALEQAPASKKSVAALQDGAVYAHRICAGFLPETWLDATGEYIEGAAAIEPARWALKCQLCKDPDGAKHGAKIQCTKGKCTRTAHVGCALEQDSGWFLDFHNAETADVEGPVALCRAHNPRHAKEEAQRKEDALRLRIHEIELGTWIDVKCGGSVWAAKLCGVDDAARRVLVQDAEGEQAQPIPWTHVVPKRAERSVERESQAYVLECTLPVRRVHGRKSREYAV